MLFFLYVKCDKTKFAYRLTLFRNPDGLEVNGNVELSNGCTVKLGNDGCCQGLSEKNYLANKL